SYGYRWMILRSPEGAPSIEDLAVGINAVSGSIETAGHGERLLCAVFAFTDAQKRRVYFIYNYKRGFWYPFVPADGSGARAALAGSRSAPPRPPLPGGAPPPSPTPPAPPRRPWWLAKRVLLAGLGVVLLSGGATAVLAVNEVNKVVEALRQSRQVKLAPNVLAPTSRGAPETLLLVGNDERPPPKNN